MNKLDEIEEHIDKEGITLSTFTAKLLIRAVRQLGARHNAMMDVITSEYAKISFARDYAIDSDVLALLEEGR